MVAVVSGVMPDDIAVSELVKNYGKIAALANVSFAVAAGEIFGLLGRNGAGKTTAIECIIGLRRPDGGAIQIAGIDAIKSPGQVKTLIGVQLQATALQEKITPREALRLFARFYPQSENIDSLIEKFSLGEKADAHFETLSDGQRQRLGLALAVVHRPKVVFLDEPTAGLDVQSRRQLHEMIRQMRGDGRTILLSTHDLDEAEQLCDRVAIMHHGKIVACDTSGNLRGEAKSLEEAFVRATGDA
jgi:ABC-2 type transport system ATP-binding protein